MIPELSILSLWHNHSHALPICLSQPFPIYGTLAIAESQVREVKEPSSKSSRSRSRSTSRTRPRRMVTSSIPSVLGLYRSLPWALYRLFKAMSLNVIIDSLVTMPVDYCIEAPTNLSRIALGMLYTFGTSTIIAPLRLLCTEIVVFRRFDWRCLQLNSRIIPIFLPNFLRMVATISLGLLNPAVLRHWDAFCAQLSSGLQLSLYLEGWRLSLVLGLWIGLYLSQVLIEVIRVRTDLYVLNGDSAHSIVPIDESYEGGVIEAISSTKEYSVYETVIRYLKVSSIPELFIYTLSRLMIPFVNINLHR